MWFTLFGETIHNDLSSALCTDVAPDPLDLVDTVGGDWHRDYGDADAGAAEPQLSGSEPPPPPRVLGQAHGATRRPDPAWRAQQILAR